MRNFSPSRLRKLLTPFSPTTSAHTRPAINSFHSLIIDPLPTSLFSQNPAKSLPLSFFWHPFSAQPEKIKSSPRLPLTHDGNYKEASEQAIAIFPGCGIQMQDIDPKQPGYSIKPSVKGANYKKFKKMTPISDESEISDSLKRGIASEITDAGSNRSLGTVDNGSDEMSERVDDPGGSITANQKPVVCARCHSLRCYQKLKDPSVENLLPDFDFDHTVGRRFMSIRKARTVVLLVVDASDFDAYDFDGSISS